MADELDKINAKLVQNTLRKIQDKANETKPGSSGCSPTALANELKQSGFRNSVSKLRNKLREVLEEEAQKGVVRRVGGRYSYNSKVDTPSSSPKTTKKTLKKQQKQQRSRRSKAAAESVAEPEPKKESDLESEKSDENEEEEEYDSALEDPDYVPSSSSESSDSNDSWQSETSSEEPPKPDEEENEEKIAFTTANPKAETTGTPNKRRNPKTKTEPAGHSVPDETTRRTRRSPTPIHKQKHATDDQQQKGAKPENPHVKSAGKVPPMTTRAKTTQRASPTMKSKAQKNLKTRP